jgi:hypothetical protein
MHPQWPPLRRSPQGACIPPDLPPDRASSGFFPRVFGVLGVIGGGGGCRAGGGPPKREGGLGGRGVGCIVGGGFRESEACVGEFGWCLGG